MADSPQTKANETLSLLLAAHTASDDLIRLFDKATANTSTEDLLNRLDDYLKASYDHKFQVKHPSAAYVRDSAINDWAELALFSALGTVCIERTRAFDGTTDRSAFTADSYAREMRYWPLWQNPGLSGFGDLVRRYHVANSKQLFVEVSPATRRRVASTLLVDDAYRHSGTSDELPVTQVDSEYIYLNAADISLRCAATPREHETPDDLPQIEIANGIAHIPYGLFERQLEAYASVSWAKLVNTYYQHRSERMIQRALNQCSQIKNEITTTLASQNHKLVYGCCYGTKTNSIGSERNTVAHGGVAPDKRLTNIVDAVRAHPEFDIDNYHTADELYEAVSDVIPAPHRPSTAISSIGATQKVLDEGFDAAVEQRHPPDTETDKVEYRLTEPAYTPLYTTLSDEDQTHLWDAYISVLRTQASYRPTTDPTEASGSATGYVGAVDAEECVPRNASVMKTAREQAHRAVVTDPKQAQSVHDVSLLADPTDFPALNRDEQLFLTRLTLAMGRLIEDYDLTESMGDFDDRTADSEGNQLDIDLKKLESNGFLTEVDELKGTYYEVPYSARKRLTSASVSHTSRPTNTVDEYGDPRYGGITHDGYAEDHPHETTAHRVGVAQMAEAIEDTCGCDETVKYYDIHRLRPKNIPLVGLDPAEIELTAETAATYGLEHVDTPTAADIHLDQLDGFTESCERLGDISLKDENIPCISLAEAGLGNLTLADLGLDEIRNRTLDVVGFEDGLLKHAVEVQRRSGSASATQRNFQKLVAVDKLGSTTHWHCPTMTDLRCVMGHLNHPDYLDFESFPDRKKSTDRPSLWRRTLDNQRLWQPGFRTLSTARSIEVVRR